MQTYEIRLVRNSDTSTELVRSDRIVIEDEDHAQHAAWTKWGVLVEIEPERYAIEVRPVGEPRDSDDLDAELLRQAMAHVDRETHNVLLAEWAALSVAAQSLLASAVPIRKEYGFYYYRVDKFDVEQLRKALDMQRKPEEATIGGGS